MKQRDDALVRALVEAGGVKNLAASLGLCKQAVSNWHRVPASRVLAVEAAIGGKVTRHELRPDIYPAG